MNGIWLSISSLTISIFLVVIFLMKKNETSDYNTIYKNVLLTNLAFTLNGVLIYLSYHLLKESYLIIFLQKTYLSLLNVVTFFLLKYIICFLKLPESKQKICNITNITYLIIVILLILLMPLSNDPLNITGLSYYIAMISIIIYFIFLSLSAIKILKDNLVETKKLIPYGIFIFTIIIGLIIKIYLPEVLTETYWVTFTLLVMYFTNENPNTRLIDELVSSKEQSDKSNASKTEFITSMSHEIRTPLNGILGFSEAILDEQTLEAAKQDARDIIDSARSLLDIVNGISNMSKLETNKIEVSNKSYNLRDEIASIMTLIKNRIGEKDVDLKLYIANEVPEYLYGDKAKLKEILSNILNNAVKYTERGYIKLNVNCLNKNDTSSLIISIEDTGRGIKQDNLNNIFEKSVFNDDDYNTTVDGVGLGLAITKKLVDILGGSIEVQSDYGRGSKFTVYLRQKISNERDYNATESNTHPLYADKRVLIVDDNELNLKIAIKLLSKYNLNIDTCTSGEECVDLLHCDNNYDLIILDDVMPEQSGIETLHIIRKKGIYNGKIIVLTANAMEGMRDKYISEGFDDYLSKPIDKKELERNLRRFLNNKVEDLPFEPLPDSIYDISDTVILKMNQDRDPSLDSIDDLTIENSNTKKEMI